MNIKLKISFFLIVLSLSFESAFSQIDYKSYYPSSSESNTSIFSAEIYNNNFIKNNEYFGKQANGITYIGSVLIPKLSWKPSDDLKLSVGWYARYFYGTSKIYNLPYISVNYNFLKNFNLTIGAIEGDLRHGYLEPIYSVDNYFEKNPEYGLQLKYNNKNLKSEFFLDWENFIFKNDTVQEILNGGINANYRFSNSGFSANIQGLIRHFGGQVNTGNSLVTSRANLSAGLDYKIKVGYKLLQNINLSANYIQCADLSTVNDLPYDYGYGILSQLTFSNLYAKFQLNWLKGEYFFAPLGEIQYQSIGSHNEWYLQPDINIISPKLFINYPISHGIDFGFKLEAYYDINLKQFNYSYGVNIAINRTLWHK